MIFVNWQLLFQRENLHAPVFTQISYSAIVFRGSARGTEVLRVAATDADIDQYNAAVRFEISHKKFFIMNATSGVLTTKADRWQMLESKPNLLP